MKETVFISGVGPGLGASLARRFAADDCAVALVARSGSCIEPLAGELEKEGVQALPIRADLTRADEAERAFDEVRKKLGPVTTLINHIGAGAWSGFENLDAGGLEHAWKSCVLSAFHCTKQVVPDMLAHDGGNILFTGATSSIRGRAGALAFSSAKFAVRGFADALAREVWPKGIHVAHVLIDGVIDTPGLLESGSDMAEGPLLEPDAIAESYWTLTRQHRSAWTFELEVRPHEEAFYE